jgi:hypothetical protein
MKEALKIAPEVQNIFGCSDFFNHLKRHHKPGEIPLPTKQINA